MVSFDRGFTFYLNVEYHKFSFFLSNLLFVVVVVCECVTDVRVVLIKNNQK